MNNPDPQTVAIYDSQSDDYEAMMVEYAKNDPRIHDFIAACPNNGLVLDLGCGPGNYAAMMAASGLQVDAIDASKEMVRRAHQHQAVDVRHGQFEDITQTARYDGIWANFSLLHASRDDFPDHLKRLHRALKPSGTFFIGMKTGTGEGRDDLGRYYTYYSQEELETHLENAGFTPTNHWTGYGKGLSGQYSGFVTIAAHA